MADHLRRGGAEQGTLELAEAARAHDDRVAAELLGEAGDRLAHRAGGDVALVGDVLLVEHGAGRSQRLLALFAVEILDGGAADEAGDIAAERGLHVEEMDLERTAVAEQSERALQGAERILRAVDRDENLHFI